MSLRLVRLFFVALVIAFTPAVLPAQPFGEYLVLNGTHGYVEVPHSAALNPSSEITIEAWILLNDNPDCTSIVGKNFQTSYWVGVCGRTLRSYTRGGDRRVTEDRFRSECGRTSR